MLRAAGLILIGAGVAVWIVFAAVWLIGVHPEAGRFLPFHLAGVIPGAVLSRLGARRPA